jgi:DNA repair exonuclease SbcCD ATPase subunit
MSQVVETVLSINAGNSAETLKGLRAEAKQYREQMNSAKVSSDEFNEAQQNLNNTLAQIKNVLSLGTKEFQEANGSYDSLVRTMSQLTQAWRATGDEATRAALGKKILEINTQLKELDASRGNFQRNVGNYQSAFDGLSTSMSQVIRELPSLQMGMSTFVLAISNNLPILFDNIQRVNAELAEMRSQGQQVPSTIGAIAKSFMSLNTLLMAGILILQLVVNNWDKIASLWRDKTPEELAKEAIEEMNEALERQQDLLKEQNTEALRRYTEALREVGGSADKAREALEKFNDANRQSELAAATKQLEEAYKAEEKAYEAYVAAASGSRLFGVDEDEVNAALEALNEARSAVTDAKNEIAQAENAIAKAESDRAIQATENAQKAEEEHQKELARLSELQAKIQEVAGDLSWIGDAVAESIPDEDLLPLPDFEEGLEEYEEYFDKVYDANNKFYRRQKKLAEAEEKAKKELTINATAEMLGNVASLFEENTAAYKAFAIAEATIATFSAAVKSFEQLGGWPFGLIGMAASIAAGLVQVKNIISVDPSGKSMSMPTQSAPAIVSAPAVVQEVPITRTMLDAGQEDRINSKFKDQRVYVVFSDIENAGKRVNVQREESSF